MALKNNEQDVKTGFMQRWSERKVAAKAEVDSELKTETDLKVAHADELENSPLDKSLVTEENVTEPEIQEFKTDEDMPPVEELTEDSNYSDFLSPKVSDALRKQALRKLFHLPFLNVVDGLDDYAEDYTKFAALGDIIPHEMKRMLEREKSKELEKQEAELLDEQETELLDEADELDELKAEESKDDIVTESESEKDKNIPSSEKVIEDSEVQATADELINLNERIDNEKLN